MSRLDTADKIASIISAAVTLITLVLFLAGPEAAKGWIKTNYKPIVIIIGAGFLIAAGFKLRIKIFQALSTVWLKTKPYWLFILTAASFVLTVFLQYLSSPNIRSILTSIPLYSLLFLIAYEIFRIKGPPKRVPLFADGLSSGLEKWLVLTGTPTIDLSMGNPAPSLSLPATPGERTFSFACIREIQGFRNGVIECDVFLLPGSLINIVFRANIESKKYYIARLDTRGGDCDDAFLRNDGAGWDYICRSHQVTTPNEWHHMRIELRDQEFSLFRDHQPVASVTDTTYALGQIGVFNELEAVHIDNFIVTSQLADRTRKNWRRPHQPWSYDFYEHYASAIPHNMQEDKRHKHAKCNWQFKKALWAHPPKDGDGYYLYKVPIPKNMQRAKLSFSIGIRDGADMQPSNNIVQFKIYVDDRLEFDKPLRGFYWQPCFLYVDVPPGDECEVKFVTNAMGEDRGNWAVWGEPILSE